jgi:hypothetical protein
MSEIANVKTVNVPSVGKLPLADKPGTFTPSGVKREHKAGRLAEDGGYIETPVPAKLELSIHLLPGVDVTKLNAIKDEDVTVRLSNGEVHMMARAFVTDSVPVGDGESKITIMANISEKIS